MAREPQPTPLCPVCKRLAAHPLYGGRCEDCWAEAHDAPMGSNRVGADGNRIGFGFGIKRESGDGRAHRIIDKF